TAQRLAVFQAMQGRTDHPAAEDVFLSVRETLPTISRGTVYKILNELVAIGELRQVDVGDGRTRFDPNTAQHVHLRCVDCGQLLDLDCEADIGGCDDIKAGAIEHAGEFAHLAGVTGGYQQAEGWSQSGLVRRTFGRGRHRMIVECRHAHCRLSQRGEGAEALAIGVGCVGEGNRGGSGIWRSIRSQML
ncbi:transcriptional repressor, partial [bacterium]|nr:transcriptional repressor [bacterium]